MNFSLSWVKSSADVSFERPSERMLVAQKRTLFLRILSDELDELRSDCYAGLVETLVKYQWVFLG